MRIKSEHCIGLLKGRFPLLERIRIQIKTKKDLIKINRKLIVCSILHNLLIKTKYQDEWIENESDDEEGDEDGEDSDILGNASINETRRDQLLQYLKELNMF